MQRAISTRDGPGQIYAGFLAGITDSPTPSAVSHVRAAGVALLSAALTENLDRAVEVGPDIVVTQLLWHVEGHLGDPALSLSGVAAAHHMSPRSLQRLLAGEGLTFSFLVRSRRLELIRRDLADPAHAHRSIAAVAARWGVLDQPWLSRASGPPTACPRSSSAARHSVLSTQCGIRRIAFSVPPPLLSVSAWLICSIPGPCITAAWLRPKPRGSAAYVRHQFGVSVRR